jgi:pyridoxal phosphate enzyme (YggS family)
VTASGPAPAWEASIDKAVGAVRARMDAALARAGRDPASVRLVAVTKTHPIEVVAAARRAGIEDLGENRAADLARKAPAVPAVWHFLGKLQSGTVRHVADHADVVHSGEPGRALDRMGRRRADSGRSIEVLVEVDFTGRRQGVRPDAVIAFASEVASTPGLRLTGLMTVPPPTSDPEGARAYFVRLRHLSHDLQSVHPLATELSMGMSVDYEVAIEEGATMVRVGTALFGPRPAGP